MITKEFVKSLLETNNKAVERALLVLLTYQTADEIQTENTRHSNGRGFNHVDAPIMTSMANWVSAGAAL